MTEPNQYLVFVDESFTQTHYIYSAVFVDSAKYHKCYDQVLEWRTEWEHNYGIPVNFELHATKLCRGAGRYPVNHNRGFRAQLFYEAIGKIEKLDGLQVMNASIERSANIKDRLKLFENILNRINVTLRNKNGICNLICDEGNEVKRRELVRAMKQRNLINVWGKIKDMPLDRIIGDPSFIDSKDSHFIQIADLVAFSLLRNEHPLANTHEFVKTAFEQLDKVLIKEASRRDPRGKGIVRPK